MSELRNLTDHGVERALIGSIIRHGRDALIDVADILNEKDFTLPINASTFVCLKALAEETSTPLLDPESIRGKAKQMALGFDFTSKDAVEYLSLVSESSFPLPRVRSFALHLRKLSVCRDLYDRCRSSAKHLESLDGSEAMSQILCHVEGQISDFMAGVEGEEKLEHISVGLSEKIQELLSGGPVTQIGIPTGYSNWDRAIGGGPRPGSVHVVVARPKTGKSWLALNIATNVTKQGFPVLVLDSEMMRTDQQSRLLAIDAGVPLGEIETGQFALDGEKKRSVLAAAERCGNYKFHYQSVCGAEPEEIINVARRWLTKHVGFNEKGLANPCLIVYDYLKIVTSEGLSSYTPEHILLGLIATKFHVFAKKYGLPILAFAQANRDGISTEDSSIVAASDRILWLCSSLSILKNKDIHDDERGCGSAFGNKKWLVIETRNGAGLDPDDYINLKASLRPGVALAHATGRIEEGCLFSQARMLGEAES